MRYTFKNEVIEKSGLLCAVYDMWEMTGFGPWKKRSDKGVVTYYEGDLKNLYEIFASGRSHGKSNPYAEESIDIEEFRKGFQAIQAYRQRMAQG